MGVSFVKFVAAEANYLLDFVVADTYPYNANPQPTREQVREWLDSGLFARAWWITLDDTERVGLLHYDDASAAHVEVHIRSHTPYRSRGIGTHAIAWVTDHVFNTLPTKHRIEGWTRVDNVAMRRVFRRCGFVKEAHLRQDFPTGDGTYVDKVGYAILRDDWSGHKITPVRWDDEDTAE